MQDYNLDDMQLANPSVFEAQDKPLNTAIDKLREAADKQLSGMTAEEVDAIALYLETEVKQ